MELTVRQYDMLIKGGKSSSRGSFKRYAGNWDAQIAGIPQNAKHKWGFCYNEHACYGVPFVISAKFSPEQKKEIEKGMKEIEQVTCIR